MVSPERSTEPATTRTTVAAAARPLDLLDHVANFLSTPSPRLLLVKGTPGSGKSTFLRSLAGRVKGPRLYLMYRLPSAPGVPAPGRTEADPVSLLLIDPEGSVLAEPAAGSAVSAGASPPTGGGAKGPEVLTEAVTRMARTGGGHLFIDSWDRATEAAIRASGSGARSAVTMTTTALLQRDRLAELPVHTVAVTLGPTDEQMDSMADGVIELGLEKWEGPAFRVASLLKIRSEPTLEPRYIYSLEGGQFYCRTQPTTGLVPPIGPPDPEAGSDPTSAWPGSQSYANAFGRLRSHSLTGLEMPAGAPNSLSKVFTVPMAAHVLRVGGRVVWVPSTSVTPAQLCAHLTRVVPGDFIRERLRILSASGYDATLGDLKSVVLPIRTEVSEGRDLRPATARAITPLFPDAFHFLKGTEAGKPALFLLSFDGLRALSAVSGATYDATTFPIVVGAYARLPGFHGFGVGVTGDPFTTALIPSLDTHLRIVERYGRILVFGIHPTTGCFMLDWRGDDDRYSLLPLS